MNCGRFQRLVFEYMEGSLSPRTHAAAERHSTNCSICRELVLQQRESARLLTEGFRRNTAAIAFTADGERRLIAALQQPSVNVHDAPVFFYWWRRVAWVGAGAAVLVIALVFTKGLPFRSDRPAAVSSDVGSGNTPILVRFSYCSPIYTFRREGELVTDSLSCTPRLIEQTLWVERNQKPDPTNSAIESRL
jgi:hypothetical protein